MPRLYVPLLKVLAAAVAFYIINKAIFVIPGCAEYYASYHYPVEVLVVFFTLCSLIIVLLLIKIHEKMPDNTGYAFMAATTVKMGICFFMLRPILAAGDGTRFEKMNFFALFILFLATETIVTIRLLNKKQ